VNSKVPLVGLHVMPVSSTIQLTVTVSPVSSAIFEHSAKLSVESP